MNLFIENAYLQFRYDPAAGWSLSSRDAHDLVLEGVRLGISYRSQAVRQPLSMPLQGGGERVGDPEWGDPHWVDSPHGRLKQTQLQFNPASSRRRSSDRKGAKETETQLHCALTFALPESQPILIWKLELVNQGAYPIYPDRLELLRLGDPSGSQNPKSKIQNLSSSNLAFFSNGWESLNYTGVYGASERFKRSRQGFLYNPLRVNAGTPQPKSPGHFSSDFFGVLGDRTGRKAVLVGFLSQQQHFGSLESGIMPGEASLCMWANGDHARLEPGQSIETDWACLHFLDIDAPDPLAPYLEAVARQHGINLLDLENREAPTGWCSWYHYFNKITAHDIEENLQVAAQLQAELPLDVIQIDDGYETRVGDWFSIRETFPEGMASPARQIEDAGFTPGLWLAPFVVALNSHLAREHPDWLIRGRFNRPANGGLSSIFWGSLTSGLDLTHPDALAYTQEVIDAAINRWGYRYLKLDFLYAAALPGRRHDPTRTRAQVLRDGLQALRQVAGPETFLLGSVCPIGSGIGLLDAMRVEADVDRIWHPAIRGVKFLVNQEPDFPCARNAVQNALTRSFLNRRWWINDPDCMLLRPDSELTLAETQTLATVIAFSGGLTFFSDQLSRLPPERMRIAQAMLPPIGRRPRLLDWFDAPTPRKLRLDLENSTGSWHLLAWFNWEDAPQDTILSLADYDLESEGQHPVWYAHEFWSGNIYPIHNGGLALRGVPAHGVVFLAVRPVLPDQPQYLGSDLNVSQGLEVASWNLTSEGLRLRLEQPGPAHKQAAVGLAGNDMPGIILRLTSPPVQASVDGTQAGWEDLGDACYRLQVPFSQSTEIFVQFSSR